MRNLGSLLTLSLLTGATGVVSAVAQTPPDGRPPSEFSDSVSVSYVLVPVVARSPTGYARKLDRADFRLTVDGVPVAIESFEEGAAAPVSVLFLQDLSGSMSNADKLRLSRLAIARILTSRRVGDQFGLATFADAELRLRVPLSGESEAIEQFMSSWQPYGVTALHDAVFGLPELTDPLRHAKRAAILITDGADNASEMDPGEARNRVRRAELPVYVLGLATGSPSVLDREGNKLHRYADVLNLLAHLTGGQYFWISSVDDVVRASGSVVADLRHQYVLGFSTIDSGGSRYRKIEVTTRKKDVRLTFRRGYEGPPPRSVRAATGR